MAKPKKRESWEIESDARTLIEAKEILGDKGRLPEVRTELKRQATAAQAALEETKCEERVSKKLKKAFE